MNTPEEQELHRLRMENQQLKEIIAEKELALRIKDSLLKNNITQEDRLMVAQKYIDAGSPISMVLHHAGLSRSTYYYKPSSGKRGRTSSTHTLHTDGYLVSNTEVVEAIIWLLSQEFVDYGCVKVTKWLQRRGLIINKKKVLVQMRMHRLLLTKPQRDRTGKI